MRNNIEIHGLNFKPAVNQIRGGNPTGGKRSLESMFMQQLKSALNNSSLPKDFLRDEIVITTPNDDVEDLDGNRRPFIRLFSTYVNFDLVRGKNLEILRGVLSNLADLEINNLAEFRPKKE